MTSQPLRPIERRCGECYALFVVTLDEQRHYAQMGYLRDDGSLRLPNRCPACRTRNRQYDSPRVRGSHS